MNYAERLRSFCADIRRKTYPISDVVPVMQAAADAIDAMQSALDDAVAKLAARDAEIERLRKDLTVCAELVARVLGGETSFPEVVSEEVKGGE